MFRRPKRVWRPLDDRGPLRVMFVITSMPVGGAETLLVNLVRHLDPDRFLPEVCCLKEMGPLGEQLAAELPLHSDLTRGKYDARVWGRLTRLFESRQVDAVVTVGAGDKMFWGRLAAWRAHVPVVLSAIHSTGWPDGIGWLNRRLTSITDGFIAVAARHGQHLVEVERFPREKVFVIPNGVDVERFRPRPEARPATRDHLGLGEEHFAVGIVAALRPEKNHELFLAAAREAARQESRMRFFVIGDGPRRRELEQLAEHLDLGSTTRFLGARGDIDRLLSGLDALALTSHNEANPVCLLEASAAGLPVVSTRVGSVDESVSDGQTGLLTPPGDSAALANAWLRLALDRQLAAAMGAAGREAVKRDWSLAAMTAGYEQLIERVYRAKTDAPAVGSGVSTVSSLAAKA